MIWKILGIKSLTSTVYTRISLNTQVSLPVDNNRADVDEDINPKEGVMLRIFRLPTFVLFDDLFCDLRISRDHVSDRFSFDRILP